MTHKIEHNFFLPFWQFELAKYQFAMSNKIKGFRTGKIDKGLLAIIDIRYKDQIFTEVLQDAVGQELKTIDEKTHLISYSLGEVKNIEDGWNISLIVEIERSTEGMQFIEQEKKIDEDNEKSHEKLNNN